MSYWPIQKLIVADLVRSVIIFLIAGHWPVSWAPCSQLATAHPVSVQSGLTSSYPQAPVAQVHYSRQVLPQNFVGICLSSRGFYAFRKSLPLLFDRKNYLPKIENYVFSPYVIDASLQLRPVSCLTYWILKLWLFCRVKVKVTSILLVFSNYISTLFNSTASFENSLFTSKSKGKGKAVPLKAWSGPEGSRKLRFPDFMTTAQDGGKVVSLTHRPPLPPGNIPGTHFC